MGELLPALLVASLLAAEPPLEADVEPAAIAEPLAAPATEDVPVSTPGLLQYTFVENSPTPVNGQGPTRISVRGRLTTPTYGYFPVLVSIDNSSGPAQTLQLSFTDSSTGRAFSRAVEVRAGERLTASLPVLSNSRSGAFRASGPGFGQGATQLSFVPVNRPQVTVLHIGAPAAFEALAGVRPAYSGGNALVANLEPSAAPAELASYLGEDAVVVTTPFLELTEAQRHALESYAALGGHLVLGQGRRGLDAALPFLGQGAALASSYGLGEVSFCEHCAPSTVVNLLHEVDPPVKPAVDSGRRRRGWSGDELSGAGLLLPIARAPVGRFLAIIALFTLAIGPGSLWVSRRKGPAALLVTIPGTALLTCGLIVGYSLVRDGFSVHTSVKGFTLLDSRQHRALTASVAGFYANLSPGSAQLPPDALAIGPVNQGYGAAQTGASITWTQGARFGADFIPSRSYLEWGLLSSQPTRARLVIKVDGPTVRVQNALGGRVHDLQLMVNDRVYRAHDLDDGQEALASPGSPGNLDDPELTSRASARLNALLDVPLKEGQFLAVLDGPGFTQLGGLELGHDHSVHLVRGEVER